VPVRFRCATCNGKLSIATRKIGMSVECPRCRESMIVPSASQIGEELTELLAAADGSGRDAQEETPDRSAGVPASKPAPRHGKSLEDMPLFEKSDFDKLLDPRLKPPKPLPLPAENQPPTPVDGSADTDAIVISRTKATVLAVAMVILLGLAFGLGYIVRGYASAGGQ